ncbi:MAG: zf-HC2 domain-containing protein [Terracidiphilus sp.]|nr:zf-HC2 domain-containing protein [Terracidiphilus sp.]
MSDQRRAVCCDLFANLSAYLDGRVERVTCRQVRAHIETCPSCVAFLRGLRGAVAPRLRAIFTREYPRRPVMPAAN